MGVVKSDVHRRVSLSRALSKLDAASRTVAFAMIRDGRVRVNAVVIRDPAFRCSLDHDRITMDGSILRKKKPLTILMNKPRGVVTTRSDERGRRTVYDLLGEIGRWVIPVGRLDKDTTGLLLFTNDHRLADRLTDPESGTPKRYLAILDVDLRDADRRRWESGITLDGEKLRAVAVHGVGGRNIEITLIEGKNRQIRRMCEASGYRIVSLERIRIGNLEGCGLAPGEWKILTQREMEMVSSATKSLK